MSALKLLFTIIAPSHVVHRTTTLASIAFTVSANATIAITGFGKWLIEHTAIQAFVRNRHDELLVISLSRQRNRSLPQSSYNLPFRAHPRTLRPCTPIRLSREL